MNHVARSSEILAPTIIRTHRRKKQDLLVKDARYYRLMQAHFMDSFMRWVFRVSAAFSVIVTLGIAFVLIFESLPFFAEVPFSQIITETEWAPLFAEPKFGILPLLCGTLVTTLIALSIAVPFGLIIALYLSEYANPRIRELLKPALELLSAIPTVVFGYFALLVVTPFLQTFIPDMPGFNMLSAGIVMGFMIIPYISSLSEDAMRSVPRHMREGSIAMGATTLQTATRVVIPAAFSGIVAAGVLGVARAAGETMIVAIAAGMQAQLTVNPLEPAQTMTAYIVQVSLGDLPHGSVGYQSIFVVGVFLMAFNLVFNIGGHWIRRRFYES